jgi:hypothetical protein
VVLAREEILKTIPEGYGRDDRRCEAQSLEERIWKKPQREKKGSLPSRWKSAESRFPGV